MLSRWALAKPRGPHCNNLWSSPLVRTPTTQSSFRERYLHFAPSHLSSAHCSVCSSRRVQFFTRKPAILHEGVGGVRPFLQTNSRMVFRTTIAWSRRSLLSKCQTVCRYTPTWNVSCTAFPARIFTILTKFTLLDRIICKSPVPDFIQIGQYENHV